MIKFVSRFYLGKIMKTTVENILIVFNYILNYLTLSSHFTVIAKSNRQWSFLLSCSFKSLHVRFFHYSRPLIEPGTMIGDGGVEKISIRLRVVFEAGNVAFRLHVSVFAPRDFQALCFCSSFCFFWAVGHEGAKEER